MHLVIHLFELFSKQMTVQKGMLKFLDACYAFNRIVLRMAVQAQQLRMRYADENMAAYVDNYTSLFS